MKLQSNYTIKLTPYGCRNLSTDHKSTLDEVDPVGILKVAAKRNVLEILIQINLNNHSVFVENKTIVLASNVHPTSVQE